MARRFRIIHPSVCQYMEVRVEVLVVVLAEVRVEFRAEVLVAVLHRIRHFPIGFGLSETVQSHWLVVAVR